METGEKSGLKTGGAWTDDIRSMTALELGAKIKKRELSCVEAARSYLAAIRQDGEAGEGQKINAYISLMEKEALEQAEAVQKRIDAGEELSLLAGVPAAVKDNICTKGAKTTAASKMLADFLPPYDATAVERLRQAGAVIMGKANLDEYAMGGSTETSFFGITRNPWDRGKVPGGSSGGSAAAVAARLAPYALGSDTGGSIRQPCAFCNLTGIKPTYGSVSRYGLIAYASSLDQIGTMGRDIGDCAAALAVISGCDPRDSTSVGDPFDFRPILESGRGKMPGPGQELEGMRIGIPKNYFTEALDGDVGARVLEAAKTFEKQGAILEELELPLVEYAVPAYYIIACAEASSNLSRYDGIKYGYRWEDARDVKEVFYRSRSEGFGKEVKRRIMLGSFALSAGYCDAYYKKALQVRNLIKRSFDEAFNRCDVILSPVTTTTAYEVGEQIKDPLAMYMADIYTVSVNLAGLPAAALPCGFDRDGMPVGMQLIGRPFSETVLVTAAQAYQNNTDYHTRFPGECRGTDSANLRGEGAGERIEIQNGKGGQGK